MPLGAQSGAKRYSSPPILTLVLFGVGGQCHALATLPLKRDPAHIVEMAGRFPVAYWGGGLGCSNPPRNSEGPPKFCQTQPDCENC